MTNDILLSVIVTIYNKEDYLHRCVDSLLHQTYHNLQIILVDDGSTDESGRICDEYMTQDSRVVVIHQKNQGVVVARKKGFSVAAGYYVAFVDADDWVEVNMYEALVKEAQKRHADRVFCDFYEVYERGAQVNKLGFNNDPNKLLASLLAYRVPLVIWNGLFKREIVKQTFEICISNAAPAEDYYFNVVSLGFYPRLAAIAKPLYHYNMSDNGFVARDCDLLYESRVNIDAVYQFLVSRGLAKNFLSIMLFTPFRVKVSVLNKGNIEEAIKLFSYSNSIKEFYSFLPMHIRWIYWGLFNWGTFGRCIYFMYSKVKNIIK